MTSARSVNQPASAWIVNSSCVNAVVQAAQVLGCDTQELLQEVNIRPASLRDPESHHAFRKYYEFYRLAERVSGDPNIGVYAGRIDYVNRLNLHLYVKSRCRTFREYLNLMPSALRYEGDIGEARVRREGSFIRLDWKPLWPESHRDRYLSDQILTFASLLDNSTSAMPISVHRACFTYPEPEDTTLLESVFGSDLSFDEPTSSLHYPAECLDYPITQLYGSWYKPLGQSVRHLFDDSSEDSFISSLRDIIVRLLPSGNLTIDAVAHELHVSRRTLQRRLTERDCLFQNIVQDVRLDLALEYLAHDRLSISDIAFLLGYSDHGSFTVAFKNWKGLSPRDYRQWVAESRQVESDSVTRSQID